MKTEQLVVSLVADRAQSSAPLGRSIGGAVALDGQRDRRPGDADGRFPVFPRSHGRGVQGA